MDGEEHYGIIQVENLLGNINEWRNINDIVRTSMKALFEIVKIQGNSIKELEKQISNKASKNELNSGLNIKANVADVMRTFSEVASSIETRPTIEEMNALIDEKVSKSDLNYVLSSKPSHEEVRNLVENKVNQAEFHSEISTLNLKFDEFHKDFIKKSSGFATNKEVMQINQALENKANLNDVNEALNTKASKESVINALHRKANKNEIEVLLKNKVDLEEIQNIINLINNKVDIVDFDKLRTLIDNKTDKSDILHIHNQLTNKVEIRDYEILNNMLLDYKKETNKKIEELDHDIDRLIENIKKEFGNLNMIVNNLDLKKMDLKELEKFNNLLNRKCELDYFSESIQQIKKDLFDNISCLKNEIRDNKKLIEEQQQDKISIIERNIEKQTEDVNKNSEKIADLMEQRKFDQDELLKLTKNIIANTQKDIMCDINMIKTEVQKSSADCQELFTRKIDRKEYESNKIKILSAIDLKLDVIDFEGLYKKVQKELYEKSEETRQDINQILKNFEADILRNLDKKANTSDLNNLLALKGEVNHALMILQNKANISDLENLKTDLDNFSKDLINKIDYDKLDNFFNDTRFALDEMQKDLLIKANIKEVLNLLKNKPDINDVNASITRITEELDQKCTLDKFNVAMDNQAIINDALCSENCLARWNWKSGQVKNGYAIPWEIQSVNTAPDVFFWEKDKTSIFIASEGVYEITLGIYADKKPTVQVLINGEPIISAVNSSSYLIHHSGNKIKNMGKFLNNNITGKINN